MVQETRLLSNKPFIYAIQTVCHQDITSIDPFQVTWMYEIKAHDDVLWFKTLSLIT